MMVKMPWHWDGNNTDEKKRCLGAKRLRLHGVIVSKKKCHCLTEFPLGEARGQGPRALGCRAIGQRPETRDQREKKLVYGDKGRKILGKT